MCECVQPSPEEIKAARKVIRRRFSRLGLAALTTFVLNAALQAAFVVLLDRFIPAWQDNPWLLWGSMALVTYLFAIPLGRVILGRMPACAPEKSRLSAGQIVLVTVVSVAFMYIGNIVGTLITGLMGLFLGNPVTNPVETLTSTTDVLPRLVIVVLAAPVMEEYFFRKVLIDRLHQHGGKLAVIVSAMIFGLFHGNFSQFFYAAALGALFGWIYLKTGRLRYTVGLHMLINLLGGVIGPELASAVTNATSEVQAALWTLVLGGYGMLVLNLTIAGVIVVCIKAKTIRFAPATEPIPGRHPLRPVWCNAGSLLFLVASLGMMAVSLFV